MVNLELVEFFTKLESKKNNLGIKLYLEFVKDLDLVSVIQGEWLTKYNVIHFFNVKTNVIFVANHGESLQRYMDYKYDKYYFDTVLESPELMRFYTLDPEEKKMLVTPEVFWSYFENNHSYTDAIFHILLGIYFNGFFIDPTRHNILNKTKMSNCMIKNYKL